jgi:membrane fusion protein (multidrug efflux system)
MAQSEAERVPAGAPAPIEAGPADRPAAPRSRRRRLILLVGLLVLLAGLAVAAYYYWQSRFYESTNDAYVEGYPVSISARVAGNIVEVHVQDNEHVPQSAPLVVIDPCNYQLQVAAARAAVQAKQAEVEKAAADVEASRAEWVRQEQDLKRNETLAKQGVITTQALEHSQAAATAAQATLDADQRQLASVQAQVAQLKVAVDQARLQLSYTKIQAPTAGYVTQKSVEVGDYVNIGQPLLVIVPDEMYVAANFKETQLTHMQPDQPATIKVDAYPGVVFRAHVQSIQAGTGAAFSLFPPENATGNFVKVVQRVPVKIVFDEPPGPQHRLVLGMSVEARVQVRPRDGQEQPTEGG